MPSEAETLATELDALTVEHERLVSEAGQVTDEDKVARIGGRLAFLAAQLQNRRARLATARARAEQQQAEQIARQREAERTALLRGLEARRDALSVRWQAWGAEMAAIDGALTRLWGDFRVLAVEALLLGEDCRKADILPLCPDTGEQASAVMARIQSGASAILDRRH
jgi:multidrug efflux pump subunit AcrA (membrane-fusion protein)